MSDTALGFVAGVSIAVLVLVVLLIVLARQAEAAQPQLVSHNVVRDEEGRILQVETFRGLDTAGGGGGMAQRMQPEPLVEWAP